MPFEIAPKVEKRLETKRARFARLIREGAAKHPETDIFFDGHNSARPCCAITAAAFALGYAPEHYEGDQPIYDYLVEHGISRRLAHAASLKHFTLWGKKVTGKMAPWIDARLIVADMIERGKL